MRPSFSNRLRRIAFSIVLIPLAASPGLALENAKQADSFVDSIGVVTHMAYTDTAYGQFNSIVLPELVKLGVRHIRDGISDASDTGATARDVTFKGNVVTLANNNIRSILILYPSYAAQIAKDLGGAIEGVEGPNETDNTGFPFSYTPPGGTAESFPQATIDWQTRLYAAIKGQPETAALPVIGPSFSTGGGPAQVGQVPCDYANIHSYSGGAPEASLDYNVLLTRYNAPAGTPIIATECGYATYTSTGNVTEAVQAKYITRIYLDHFRRGITRAYNYELLDEWSLTNSHLNNNTEQSHFGLIRVGSGGGSPASITEKPAFTALKNLITVLADPGPAFAPSAFGVTLNAGANQNALRHVLLQKRDGTLWLVLWLSVDSSAGSASQSVTATFDRSVGQVAAYHPSASAVGTVVSSSASTSVTQTVTDDPVVLRLSSVAAPTSSSTLTADVAMFGAGEGMMTATAPFADPVTFSASFADEKIGDKANSQAYRAVVKFDLPPLPAGQIVDTATLYFRYRAKGNAPTNNLHLIAYRASQPNVRDDDWDAVEDAYDIGNVATPSTPLGVIAVSTAQFPALGDAIRDAYAQGLTYLSFRFQLDGGAYVTSSADDDYYDIGSSKSVTASDHPSLIMNLAAPSTLVIPASGSGDGFLKAASPGFTSIVDNDSIDPSARVGDDIANNAYRTFFKFDLSSLPPGAQVTGVRLKYYYLSKTGAPTRDVVLQSYEPAALPIQSSDWNAAPEAVDLGTAIGTGSGVGAYGFASPTLTLALSDALDRSKSLFGFSFKLSGGATNTGTANTYDYYVLGTSEYPVAARRPTLEIDYH